MKTRTSAAYYVIREVPLTRQDYVRVRNLQRLTGQSFSSVALNALLEYESFIKNREQGKDMISCRRYGGGMAFEPVTPDANLFYEVPCKLSLWNGEDRRFDDLCVRTGARSNSELFHMALKHYHSLYLEMMTGSQLRICNRPGSYDPDPRPETPRPV